MTYFFARPLTAILLFASLPFAALGQTALQRAVANPMAVLPADRVTAQVNNAATVALPGNIHPLAVAANDAGPVPADMAMPHLMLILKRDATQQAALDALTAAQQDPQSPLYHHWLTPEEFGAHFGVSQSDVNKISAWLVSQGFTIEEVPSSRTSIKFSGNAAQVQAAFHTPIHFYKTADGTHFANSTDQRIPQALANVVMGVAALHDFKPKPMGHAKTQAVTQPEFGGGGSFFMAPADFYTIYDLNPLYADGTDGTGETIAVTSPCSADLTVATAFWANYVKAGATLSTTASGNVPACDDGGAKELYLDVEWSGAIAKNAKILVVESDSLLDAASQVVNNKLAPIVTTSYGNCEKAFGTVETQAWASLWQTAASFGITSFVSSGDSGAAGCDNQNVVNVATQGLGVNGICSSQYAICVGGTEFNDGANLNTYWSVAGAAKSYIPEIAWNEGGIFVTNGGLWSSGGGYSTVFAKPSWQTGNSTADRGVPDVSLTAAAHDGYLTCLGKASQCGASSSFSTSSGTSAAAPSFAGIMALIVQKTGQWQGNPAPTFYSLAGQTSLNVFHDITSGNNNVPGLAGFSAGAGWDPVTGLGSVDANLLVNNWPGVAATAGPALTIPISTLPFGTQVIATSNSLAISVKSTGTAAVTISSIKIAGTNASDFSLTTTCPTGSLASGATCNITVTFSPTVLGARTAAISIIDSAPNSPQTIQLTGTAISSVNVTNLQTSTSAASGCTAGAATTAFLPRYSGTVNFFFNATVGPTDNLTVNYLTPSGSVSSTLNFNPVSSSGTFCFGSPASLALNIKNITSSQFGTWQIQILDNTALVGSASFTVGNVLVLSNASGAAPVAPGSLITIYPDTGVSLSTARALTSSVLPLPTSQNGTTVTISGIPAPLLYVDGGQINAEVPPGVSTGPATVVVAGTGGTGGTGFVNIVEAAPGIFQVAQHGSDFSYVSAGSPANAGEYIVFYGTGQGAVNGTQVSGQPTPNATCLDTVSMTIGGQLATGQFFFCGLSYFVGVTQINAQIPAGLLAGNADVVVTINGVVSNTTTLAVSGH